MVQVISNMEQSIDVLFNLTPLDARAALSNIVRRLKGDSDGSDLAILQPPLATPL